MLYGKLSSGGEVYSYSLRNNSGIEVRIINYGAIVTNIYVPGKYGKIDDVVLGYDTLEQYADDRSYMGAIVGRYGNRISKGQFTLEGEVYQLSINNGNNHLHGGIKGLSKKIWNSESLTKNSVKLSCTSQDGEEGYPGKMSLTVTYTLTDSNELKINYYGTVSKATIINPTHHSYFNLSGDFNSDILNHELQIIADNYLPVDVEQIPTGVIQNVEHTPMDFRKAKPVGQDINEPDNQIITGNGYDHTWVINNYNPGITRKAAAVYEPVTGRYLEVFTDQPGLQFYSGNSLNGAPGKNGIKHNYRTGLCLEAQFYPDSPNKPSFPSPVLHPDMIYRQETVYRFSHN